MHVRHAVAGAGAVSQRSQNRQRRALRTEGARAHVQRGGGLGNARGEELRAVALAAAARGLRHEAFHLHQHVR